MIYAKALLVNPTDQAKDGFSIWYNFMSASIFFHFDKTSTFIAVMKIKEELENSLQ